MRFSHELTYAATPAEVYAMLSDPAFRDRVCQAQGVVSHDNALTPAPDGPDGPGGFTLVSTQTQDTAGLPAIAKKITGDTTDVVITEEWSGVEGGTVEIESPGKPSTTSGRVSLTATAAGTVELVELDVKVRIPLIGGKLEALVADQIKSGLMVEQTVGAAWLAGEN